MKEQCPLTMENVEKDTPLHLAAGNGHLELVKFLVVELKCDPNATGYEDWTPLHFAAFYCHFNVLKYLIEECNCDASAETLLHST